MRRSHKAQKSTFGDAEVCAREFPAKWRSRLVSNSILDNKDYSTHSRVSNTTSAGNLSNNQIKTLTFVIQVARSACQTIGFPVNTENGPIICRLQNSFTN
jgi:hypothetical protein